QLVDRLRDLVRRSILMRLLLNSDGRWPLRGDPPPIDQLWTDPAVAKEWRAAWHYGAASVLPSPLCLHHRYATAPSTTIPARATNNGTGARSRRKRGRRGRSAASLPSYGPPRPGNRTDGAP